MPLPPRPLDAKTAALRAARLARDAGRPKAEPGDSHHRVFGLADELPFGKFRGRTIADILDAQLGYATWLLENTEVQLADDALEEYYRRCAR